VSSSVDGKGEPDSTLPLAGRVAKLAAKPHSRAREGGGKPPSLARKLRANPSPAEVRLWRIIYGLRTNGYHFRKQVHVGDYVVDFACIHAGLIVEVDGRTHDGALAQGNDAVRDDYLKGRGFTVLRFSNGDVSTNGHSVYRTIETALAARPRNHRGSPPPSPAALRTGGPSFATLPARGRVVESSEQDD